MKILAFAVASAVCLLTVPQRSAGAEIAVPGLVVGVVRTQAGDPVPDAVVEAADAAGAALGSGPTARDGTFGFAVSARAAAVVVHCPFCTAGRVVLTGDEPAIVVVRRSAAFARSPDRDDLAALPYERTGDALALTPYAVLKGDVIADRGLGGGRGAVLLDGIPQYRAIDGADMTLRLGVRDVAAFTTDGPIAAASYGSGAQGGTFVADSGGDAERGARVALGSGGSTTLRVGGDATAVTLGRTDLGGTRIVRALADTRGDLGSPNLRYQASAVVADDATDTANGAAVRIVNAQRFFDVAASASVGRSTSAEGGETYRDSEDAFAASVRTRSAVALEAGLRGSRATGQYAFVANVPYAQSTGWVGAIATTAAYLEASTRLGAWDVTANGALGRLSVGISQNYDDARTFLDGGVRVARRVGELALSGDVVESTRPLTIDGYWAKRGLAAPRSLLFDVNGGYAAGIVRVDATVYRENGALTSTAGYGATLGLALAPNLALRTWLLRGANGGSAVGVYPQAAFLDPRTQRDLVWLTYDAPVRIDALLRNGALEGDIAIPLTRAYALQLGSYVPAGFPRRTTAALRFR